MKEVPIFYTVDENYLPYLTVSVISIIKNAKSNYNYIINIIYQDLSDEALSKLKSLEKNNIRFNFYNIKDKIEPIKEKLYHMINKTHFPITIYFRIFLPTLFKEYDKGIYIDSDTVLNDDIANLYDIDLEDNLIGAAYDSSMFDCDRFTNYIENYVGIKKGKYINSGVILMNMQRLRDLDFDHKFLEVLTKYDFEVVAPDQDYINTLCKNQIKYLDERWNAMPVEGKMGIDNPKLIHYNLTLKPWHYEVAYQEYFWKYAKISDYYKKIENEFNNYGDTDKQKDKDIMVNLLNQADRLAETKKSFKSVFGDINKLL